VKPIIIKPRHTIRHPLNCRVLCSVPRTGITCSNGHARVPARTHARRKDADCPPVRRIYHRCSSESSKSVAFVPSDAPHRSTWTRHVLASTMACTLRSAVHKVHILPPHCIASKTAPHTLAPAQGGGRVRPRLHPNSSAETLFRRYYYAPDLVFPPTISNRELSADRSLAESRYRALEKRRRKSYDQVFLSRSRFEDPRRYSSWKVSLI
jgi:hypothetical protein